MIEVSSDNLWDKLEKLSTDSEGKKAAVSYITDDSAIQFTDGDTLVADISEDAIATGKTSAKVISDAFENGVEIYTCDSLHAKTIVFDYHAYIGSANISSHSRESLDEIGIISDHPKVMSGALQTIEKLKLQSHKIDRVYIDKILSIVVKSNGKPKRKKRNINVETPRSWMISIVDGASPPGDENHINEDNQNIEVSENEEPAWFWLKQGSRCYDQVKIGDSVVIIERKSPSSESPEYVYRHVTIKHISEDSALKIRAWHYAYNEDYYHEWEDFLELAVQAGITNLGSGLSTRRELSQKQSNLLFELWAPNK